MSACCSRPPGCSQVNIQLIIPNSSIVIGFCICVAFNCGAHRGDSIGEGRDDATLAVEHLLTVCGLQELHVLGQHAVCVARPRIFLDETLDQLPHLRFGGKALPLHLVDERLQAFDVRTRDFAEQLVFVAHVVIERRLRHAAGLRHFVHRCARVTLPREQLRRVREDFLALHVVSGGTSTRHGLTSRRKIAPRAR